MKPATMSMIALAALAAAGSAAARGRAEAVLAAPVGKRVNVLIESERWKCDAAACAGAINVLSDRLDGPLALRVCREIVRRAGPVRELKTPDGTMPAAVLAKCNEGFEAPAVIASRR